MTQHISPSLSRLCLAMSIALTSMACGDADIALEGATTPWGTTELEQDSPAPPSFEAPSRYEMRDGMPVAIRSTSFAKITHADNRACVIDEFAQLLCWKLPNSESSASELTFIEPIATDVIEVAVNYSTLCIIRGATARRLACLNGRGEFEPVFADDEVDALSGISVGYPERVCALESTTPRCAQVAVNESSGKLDIEVSTPTRPETYHTLRLTDYGGSIARVDSSCAVDTKNQVLCWKGSGNLAIESPAIKASPERGLIKDMRYTQFGLVGMLSGETIELLYIDPWSYETDTYFHLGKVSGEYSALYSSRCGQSVEGPVMCWDDITQPSTILFEKEPRSLSLEGRIACAITTEGDVFCQDHPY